MKVFLSQLNIVCSIIMFVYFVSLFYRICSLSIVISYLQIHALFYKKKLQKNTNIQKRLNFQHFFMQNVLLR